MASSHSDAFFGMAGLAAAFGAAGLDVGALPEPDAFAPAEPDADDEELGFGRGIGLASALCLASALPTEPFGLGIRFVSGPSTRLHVASRFSDRIC